MQTALTYTIDASNSAFGVGMIAAVTLPGKPGVRPDWAAPKHPR